MSRRYLAQMPCYDEERRVDVHAHYLAPDYRQALEAAGVGQIGGVPVPPWSLELTLDFMASHGIQIQFLSVSDPGVGFLEPGPASDLARQCNEYVAEVIRSHPQRFGAFAVLPVQEVDAGVAEAERCLDELGLDGVGLLSSSRGRYLGDPWFEPLLCALDRRGAWTFVHPAAVAAQDKPAYAIPESVAEYPFDTTRTIISLLFNGRFEQFPAIRWHFAHGGGTLPMLRARIVTLATHAPLVGELLALPPGAMTLGPEAADRAFSASFFDTALVADPPALHAVTGVTGVRGIVFGSDWPFAALYYGREKDPQPALSEVFGDADRRRIDRKNACAELPRAACAVGRGDGKASL